MFIHRLYFLLLNYLLYSFMCFPHMDAFFFSLLKALYKDTESVCQKNFRYFLQFSFVFYFYDVCFWYFNIAMF